MTDEHYNGIPKVVRIGCYLFRVEVGEMEDHECENSFGHMNEVSQKIRLRPGMTPQNLANTFIHEVLHAIYWFAGVGNKKSDTEEIYVTRGANGLCTFWQDNPEAVGWWASLLELGDAA